MPPGSVTPIAGMVERIRPITRVRSGDVFRCPDLGDAAIILSGVLVVELMMTCGRTLPLTRLASGDVTPPLDALSTPAFSLGYRAEQLTHLNWVRSDLIDADVRARAASARETLLFASMRQITCLACLPAACRLYVEILRCAAAADDHVFELPNHGELALRASTTRETISREISILRREGVVSRDKLARLLKPRDLTRHIARALNLDDESDVYDSIGIRPIADF